MSVPTDKANFYSDPTHKPTIPPPAWDAIPELLRAAIRWVLWRLVWRANADGTGKWDKVPFQTSGKAAKPNDSDTWTTFEKVTAAYKPGKYDGIGFMLGGGFAGVDLDDAIDPKTGELATWANDIVRQFNMYCELSPSATGVKLIGHGLWTGDRHRWKHETGEIEVYSERRYFTITGVLVGETTKVTNIQTALDDLAGETHKPDDVPPLPRAPGAGGSALPDDEELIRKAMAAKNGDKFRRLWTGDISGHGEDDSAADLALCDLLAFWTGPDAARNDRLFRQSGLMRRKWDEKRGPTTYGERTIAKAFAGRTEFYTPKHSMRASSNSLPSAGAVVVPAYRQFPTHCLPPVVKEFVESVAASVGCDPCFVGLPALALVGAAVGGALVARPKSGWNEVPILWAVVIGDSGTAKSPAADPVSAIAHCIEDALEDEFEQAVEKFRAEVAEYRERMDSREAGDTSDPPVKPVPPVREYFTADDITIERFIENLRTSPRGILMLQDELANWFGSFSRYKGKGGGSDSAKWLSMFDGRPVGYQRKTANPGTPRDVRVKRAIAGVSGGIQPGILAEALSNPAYLNSGLAARLVFAMPPKQCVRWTDTEPNPDADRRFRTVVHALRELPFDPKSSVPSVGLDVMARAAFTRFHDEMATTAEGHDGGGMAAAIPKLVRIGLRLAMIHHCATEAAADRDPGKASISEMSMRAGIELARWFETEAERVYAMLAEKPEDRSARMLAEWVKRKGGRVTPRDLQRSSKQKYPTSDAAEVALDALVSSGIGRWEDRLAPTSGGHVGLVFVLTMSPADGRHSPTLDQEANPNPIGTAADTRIGTDLETPDFLRDFERVSASVGRRHESDGPIPPTDPPTVAPEQVSAAPPTPKVRRRANPNRGIDGKGGA